MVHSEEYSQRDLLRIDVVARLAGLLAPGDGCEAMVVGSVALAAHLSPARCRVPNDLDIVIRVRGERLAKVLEDISEVGTATPMIEVPMFSGGNAVKEFMLSVGPPGARVIDRIPCQFIEHWPQESRGMPVAYGGVSIRVESLEWLVAHKLHALLKARKSKRVSSRVRDLFDLALLNELDRMPSPDRVRSIVELFPEPMAQAVRELPEEWRVQWRSLQRDLGSDTRLDAAWRWAWAYWNDSSGSHA